MTTAAGNAATTSEPVRWDDGDLVLTRVFDAPREMVFRAWTEPERFARWFGPTSSTIPVLEMDARPGGILHFCHRFADHPDVWVRGEFREVRAPEIVSFTCGFSDPAGTRVDRPGFPSEMTITATFAEVGGRTRVTIRQTGLVEDQGEVQGWAEGLDRLAALLATG
jgi:uncharacterized protein YndB with AHSA1/START domain